MESVEKSNHISSPTALNRTLVIIDDQYIKVLDLLPQGASSSLNPQGVRPINGRRRRRIRGSQRQQHSEYAALSRSPTIEEVDPLADGPAWFHSIPNRPALGYPAC